MRRLRREITALLDKAGETSACLHQLAPLGPSLPAFLIENEVARLAMRGTSRKTDSKAEMALLLAGLRGRGELRCAVLFGCLRADFSRTTLSEIRDQGHARDMGVGRARNGSGQKVDSQWDAQGQSQRFVSFPKYYDEHDAAEDAVQGRFLRLQGETGQVRACA